VVEHSGEHQGRLNIKQHGLIPIEAIARYVSLGAHVQTCRRRFAWMPPPPG
jgi:hypothetical protein